MTKKDTLKQRILRGLFKIRRAGPTVFILNDLLEFKKKDTKHRFSLNVSDLYPITTEKTPTTGFDRHYIYHPAWAARVVKEINPPFHIDISSTLHFCSILSAFIPVHFYDYRPADVRLDGLETHRGDL